MKNVHTTIMNDISRVTLLDKTIVEINIQNDIEFELDDAICTTNFVEAITCGNKCYHLTVFGERTIPSKEARAYCTSEMGSRLKLAEAIVVESLSQKMVFNFMINVEGPFVRTKLFTNRTEAIDWLHSLNG